MYILREFRKFIAVEMRMVEVEWKGQPSYLVSIRDVTWHVQQEEELSQAKDRLEVEVQSRRDELLRVNESLRAEVNERKRTETALRESERKYRQIVELAQEGIWIIDRKATIQFVNPRLADMLGYRGRGYGRPFELRVRRLRLPWRHRRRRSSDASVVSGIPMTVIS